MPLRTDQCPLETGERLAKILSRAGVCSRRDAEKLILEGRVAVDGLTVSTPNVVASPSQQITVDGGKIPVFDVTRLWLYHKPRGVLTTNRDPKGRPTVFETLPKDLPRVISVGRLDFDSQGLLLLTNDGKLSRFLELPSTGWKRIYRVRVFGDPKDSVLNALEKGLTLGGVRYGAIQAARDGPSKGANTWLTVTLKEGKNREIRRVMAHFGWSVNRLIRLSYGPFLLGNLCPGGVEEVPPKALQQALGSLKKPLENCF